LQGIGTILANPCESQQYILAVSPLDSSEKGLFRADYKGEYFLSNGKRMYISRLGRRLYAQIGQQREHEIRPVAEHQFEATDGSMSLNIVISRQGHVSGSIAYVDEDTPSRSIALASLNVR
jgi:alpha/beta superfamily hydrolase